MSSFSPELPHSSDADAEQASGAGSASLEEERFRIIAGLLSDVLWDYRFDTQELWMSPNWAAKLKLNIEEDGISPTSWAELVAATDRANVVDSIVQAIKSDADQWHYEFKVVDQDKSLRDLRVRAAILRDNGRRAVRILGSLSDVTDEKLQQERSMRSHTLDVVGKMTGGIAHDFNNLLMIIQGNAELLELSELDQEDQESVALISKAAQSGADLTSRLLSFSGETNLTSSQVNLEEIIGNVRVLLQSSLYGHVTVTAHVEPDIWKVEVDVSALEQAIMNLAVNARDALPQGGDVQISCENKEFFEETVGGTLSLLPGRYVCISVSDNGIGMDKETLARACEPFFTTKDVSEGAGLGLSSVYGFAKQSGGVLEIFSELGEGSTLNLYIPASEAEAEDQDRPHAKEPIKIDNAKRILVVEDQEDVRAHVEKLLNRAGYESVGAPDAQAALDLLQGGEEFDLLFTDVVMPGGMDGVQLSFEASKISPDMKVLFTSGFPARAFDQIGIEHRGDVELLKKPYKASDLIYTIARLTTPATD